MKEKKYLIYGDFLNHVNKVILKDSSSIRKEYQKTHDEVYTLLNKWELPNTKREDIIHFMYNNKKEENLINKLSMEQDLSTDIASEIYEVIKKKNFEHKGKLPLGKWTYVPNDYIGLDDDKYGTAFQCHYIEDLKLFFVVIDIDAHNNTKDIPLEKVESAIPDKYRDTRIIRTPSNGKHYYYLSRNPPARTINGDINIDYQTIHANNVSKTPEGNYKNEKNGKYVVASYRWNYDGTTKEQYEHESDSNNDILIVDNTDIILENIIENLHSQDDISDDEFNKFHNTHYNNDNVISICEDIRFKLNTDEFTSDDYKKDGLSYSSDGTILFNEDNGVVLLTKYVADVINMTHGNHNDVLIALEGGLDHYNINKDHRQEILYNALILADDFTNEHQNQIQESLKKDKTQHPKKGLPHLNDNYTNIIDKLESIINIKHMFWSNTSIEQLQLIQIPYNALIKKISVVIKQENDKKKILTLIDNYMNMMGLGLCERCQLITEAYNICQLKGIENFIKNKINDSYRQYTYALIRRKKINLPKNINSEISTPDKKELTQLACKLDIQLSLLEKTGKKPMIQPLINLIERPTDLEEYKRRQIAYGFLKDNNYLKKTENGSYIYDDVNTQSYIPIDSNKLGNYLSTKYPILKRGIESNELETILNLSGEFDELHNEYYMFNNGILDLHDRQFTNTTKFSQYFTIKKMDCNYIPNTKIVNPLKDPSTCLVDRVLREILIPEYEQNNEDCSDQLYIDFLERLGACFNTRIKEKKFACYWGDGDNGKDVLIEILKMAFGERCLLATMDILQDDKADLSTYDVVIIDELDKHTFDDAISFIKRITGGEEEGTAKRKHYSHEVFKPTNPSGFFLFTNELPQVPFNDTAFYRREDALKLKNKFIDNPNKNKSNEFQADSSLKDKIKDDKENSLEWLINTSLKAYHNRFQNGHFKGFTMTQSAQETQMIASNTDNLSKFLREHYIYDSEENETISNSELRTNYENYCTRNNINCDTSKLPQNMGNTIKKVFGDIKKKATNETLYFLKRKKEEDDTNIHLYLDTNNTWWNKKDMMPEETFESHEQVYNRIKEMAESSTPITIHQLKEEYSYYDIEEIISNLASAELIYKA